MNQRMRINSQSRPWALYTPLSCFSLASPNTMTSEEGGQARHGDGAVPESLQTGATTQGRHRHTHTQSRQLLKPSRPPAGTYLLQQGHISSFPTLVATGADTAGLSQRAVKLWPPSLPEGKTSLPEGQPCPALCGSQGPHSGPRLRFRLIHLLSLNLHTHTKCFSIPTRTNSSLSQ